MKKYVCKAINENGKTLYVDNHYSLSGVRAFVYQARHYARHHYKLVTVEINGKAYNF